MCEGLLGLEEFNRQATLAQFIPDRDPGNATPDDDGIHGARHGREASPGHVDHRAEMGLAVMASRIETESLVS